MLTIIDVKLFYIEIKNFEEIRYKMMQIILKYNNNKKFLFYKLVKVYKLNIFSLSLHIKQSPN